VTMLDLNDDLPSGRTDDDPTPDTILTVEEFAERMRWNRKTAYERIRKGEVPGVLPGKPYRILWRAVVRSVSTGQGREPVKRGRK